LINLGAQASEAIHSLRDNEKWSLFLDAIGTVATKQIQDSLQAPLDHVVSLNFYARAFNDLYIALVAATKDVNPRHVAKPGVKSDV